MLLGIIKKRLDSFKGLWPKELLSVLWAYRTLVKTPMEETPFLLAFRIDAVIPIEIGMITHRVANFD